jgi:hypothetical protein
MVPAPFFVQYVRQYPCIAMIITMWNEMAKEAETALEGSRKLTD